MKTKAMAAAFATAVTLVGLSAPAGAGIVTPPSPNEHLTFAFTNMSGNNLIGTAVASGVVNGVGTITAGDGQVFPATVTLPQGKLKLKVTSGPNHDVFNLNTCAVAFSGTDTLQVTGGTGVFKGATGSGSDTNQGAIIFARNGDGSCNFDAPKVGITVIGTLALHLAP